MPEFIQEYEHIFYVVSSVIFVIAFLGFLAYAWIKGE